MSNYTEQAKQLIKDNKYLMISKSWCGDCKYTYNIFNEFNIKDKVKILELDLYKDQNEANNLQRGFTEVIGRNWVPAIFFNGEHFDESKLKELKASGELEQFFKKHEII